MFGKVGLASRRFSVLNGLPVVSLNDGEELGKVIDILIDRTEIAGLIVDKNGWLNDHLYLLMKNIHSIGNNALIVEDENKLASYDKKKIQFFSLYRGSKNITGKILMSTEGEKLGLVEDVYFDEELGNIVGYEVTDGFIADLKEGKRVLKTTAPLTVGEEILVIDLNC
jgi:uncharacterized protein YrrD